VASMLTICSSTYPTLLPHALTHHESLHSPGESPSITALLGHLPQSRAGGGRGRHRLRGAEEPRDGGLQADRHHRPGHHRPLQPQQTVPGTVPLHCTVLHCSALHFTALYCTILHCTTLYYTALHCTAQHSTVLHYYVLYCSALYCNVLHCTALSCTVFPLLPYVRCCNYAMILY
jgi:hypothetical protein